MRVSLRRISAFLTRQDAMAARQNSLKDAHTHFRFGQNWASYSKLIDESRVAQAMRDLQKFLGRDDLAGATFLDIGCGSGVHSLAALRLDAAHVTAIDIDDDSVATTRKVLEANVPVDRFHCRRLSVFEADPAALGRFDIVYSWGVLHHTGAMHEAIERAAGLVDDDGLLALALYRKTVLCGFWKIEKRVYSRMPRWAQKLCIKVYTAKSRLGCLVKGRDFAKYVADYAADRGMDYEHDVHDWLGGFPYESVTPREFGTFVEKLGFQREHPQTLSDSSLWTLSSGGCQEIRFRKAA
jgi:2-polyprenyl-6-hydroxyphenyl methylase/3-demethylubiquinone-9 3-methyltransferase